MEIKENVREQNSKIVLLNKKNLSICGVTKFINASNTLINVCVNKSNFQIEGKMLEIVKLDIDSGILDVAGEVTSMAFDKKKRGFFQRIFR